MRKKLSCILNQPGDLPRPGDTVRDVIWDSEGKVRIDFMSGSSIIATMEKPSSGFVEDLKGFDIRLLLKLAKKWGK